MIKTKVGYACWHIGVDEQRGACNVAFIKDQWKTCDREIS